MQTEDVATGTNSGRRLENEKRGGLPEWLKGADCKSADYVYIGSNPIAPICRGGAVNLRFQN